MRRLVISAVLIWAFCDCGRISAQSATSSLRGTVFDPQHAIVIGVNVDLSNPSTGFSQSTKTDDHGAYQFLQIPPGTYTLTVSQAGLPSFTAVRTWMHRF
jgi:hypothetical protein